MTFSLTLALRPLSLIQPEPLPGLPPIPSYLLGLTRVGSTTPARGSDELPGLPSLREIHWSVVDSDDRFRCFPLPPAGGHRG